MKIIGITGGVGAGKSAVLEYLSARYEARVIQADQAGHRLMEPQGPCYEPVLRLFGNEVLDSEGRLDRKAIGKKAFGDGELLSRLDGIIHPAVKTCIKEQIAMAQSAGVKYFVVEAALLIEDDYGAICDEMWYIYTSEPVRRRRLKESRGYTDGYISEIMGKQMPEEVFYKACQVVIDNSFSMENTQEQIDKRMQIYEIM